MFRAFQGVREAAFAKGRWGVGCLLDGKVFTKDKDVTQEKSPQVEANERQFMLSLLLFTSPKLKYPTAPESTTQFVQPMWDKYAQAADCGMGKGQLVGGVRLHMGVVTICRGHSWMRSDSGQSQWMNRYVTFRKVKIWTNEDDKLF